MVPREADLFHACLEQPPERREGWLASEVPDDEALRARVRRLVEAHERAASLTIQPLVTVDAPSPVPDGIGPYRIAGVLGEGGMGVVYDAEQTEPVRRRVAVKVIRAGMDTRQVVARFMTERQALAALDHPFVARVLDAGETPEGRPYFVMERVEGQPLLDYCTSQSLGLRERLELFIRICHAVQHAHQKGVIHRDLKPSNVLVTTGDDGPRPKVIDFGIAKAVTADADASGAPLTRLDQRLGTPAYMSPEQASGQDVDTRTDIYALGVMLYELLTGRLPVDPRESGELRFLQQLASGDVEAPPPSARAPAARLSADLDAIVMKAMAAERGRRYDTAAALADDLGRYLHDEPVGARAPTTSYRMRKFVRRHRLALAATAVAATALVAGTVVAAIGLDRARKAETLAREEAATASEISDFLLSLFSGSDPNLRSATTLREVLDRAATRIETELDGHPRSQVTLLIRLGHVYASLGLHRQAVPLVDRALALQEREGIEDLETAEAALTLGRSVLQLGDLKRAELLFDRSLAIRTRLGAEPRAVAEVLNNVGGLQSQLGRLDDALQTYERALDLQRGAGEVRSPLAGVTLRGLATVHARRRDVERALEYSRQALAIYREVYGDEHAVTAGAFESVGFDLKDLKRFDEARPYAERALEVKRRVLGPEHPQTAFAYALLGELNAAEGRLAEALQMQESALRIREAALGPDNPRTAESLMGVAMVLASQRHWTRSERLLTRAHGIFLKAYGPDHSRTRGAARALEDVRRRR